MELCLDSDGSYQWSFVQTGVARNESFVMSPLTITQIQETPAGPLAVTAPLVSFGLIDVSIAAGATQGLVQGFGSFSPVGFDWLLGMTPLVYGHINTNRAEGGVLLIELSYDGTTYDDFIQIGIIGASLPTYFGPIELPGWNARFSLTNSNTVAIAAFNGCIGLKAVS